MRGCRQGGLRPGTLARMGVEGNLLFLLDERLGVLNFGLDVLEAEDEALKELLFFVVAVEGGLRVVGVLGGNICHFK